MPAKKAKLLLATVNETIRNPMKYTLGTAAKATGKSKSTIQRAIKKGTLSAIVREDGSYEIDPAELHRVYLPVASDSSEELAMKQSATSEETALLKQENNFLKQQLERERDFSKELSRRLDDEVAERRRLTAILTYKPEPKEEVAQPATNKGKLWGKLFSS